MGDLLNPALGNMAHPRAGRSWQRGTISVPATAATHTPEERSRWHGKPPTPAPPSKLWRPAGVFVLAGLLLSSAAHASDSRPRSSVSVTVDSASLPTWRSSAMDAPLTVTTTGALTLSSPLTFVNAATGTAEHVLTVEGFRRESIYRALGQLLGALCGTLIAFALRAAWVRRRQSRYEREQAARQQSPEGDDAHRAVLRRAAETATAVDLTRLRVPTSSPALVRPSVVPEAPPVPYLGRRPPPPPPTSNPGPGQDREE